jgi:hypothetical protein
MNSLKKRKEVSMAEKPSDELMEESLKNVNQLKIV